MGQRELLDAGGDYGVEDARAVDVVAGRHGGPQAQAVVLGGEGGQRERRAGRISDAQQAEGQVEIGDGGVCSGVEGVGPIAVHGLPFFVQSAPLQEHSRARILHPDQPIGLQA